MRSEKNLQVRLAARPEGLPTREHWTIAAQPVAEPTEEGQVLVQLKFLSLDPAMRGWLRDARSYMEPVAVGDVMRAGGVGTVVASKHPHFTVGEQVAGLTGIQAFALLQGRDLQKVSDQLAPLTTFLGVLGITGLSAYFGLLDVGAMAQGETVLISAAAGAVGSAAGQIAKIKGAGRVVGIAGSDEKCRHLVQDLGFDAAINYRTEPVLESIRTHCPKGVDVYFDNVGGELLDAALLCLNHRARVVLCGAISQYNNRDDVRGPKNSEPGMAESRVNPKGCAQDARNNYLSLLINRSRMEGFLIFDYKPRYPAAVMEMAGWLAAGKLQYRETIVKGLENFPEAFQRLFSGEKLGKLLLEV